MERVLLCFFLLFFQSIFGSVKIEKNGYVNVSDFGAKGDGVTDDTNAIQQAINSGKSVKFGVGVYLVSKVVLPYSFKGLTIEGTGYNHWHNNVGTVLKAKGVESVFVPENGCDWIKITNLRLEGNNISHIGFDGTFGGGAIFENVGIYNFKKVGILSRQGLLRINNCFFGNNTTGAEIYSDSTISNTEITGGEICLKLLAGGNRVNNLWLNGATKNLLVLEPLDEKTGHQNTSLVNLYLGEVRKGNYTFGNQVVVRGNKVKRVQQVQISNSFLVHATKTSIPNTFFHIEDADEVIISGINILGQHTYAEGENYTENFIKGIRANNIKITNNIIKGVNKYAIDVDKNCTDWSIVNNDFIDISGYRGANSVIRMEGNGNRFIITNNRFIDYRNNKNIYALHMEKYENIRFSDNYIYYPNDIIVSTKENVDKELKQNYR